MDERLVFGNYHYNRSSLQGFLSCMHAGGIRKTELCPYASWLDITDRENVRCFRRLLDEAGIEAAILVPEQGGVVPFNPTMELPDVENWSLDYGVKMIRNMDTLGCRKLMVGAGRQSLDCPEAEGWNRSLHSLRIFAGAAAEEGVELLLCSDGRRTFSNIVTTTDEQMRMIRQIGLSNVKAYVDLSACAAAGEDFRDAVSTLQQEGLLGHVCISDGPDGWLLPGDGSIGVAGIRNAWSALSSAGYTGDVTCRLQHWRYDFEPDKYTVNLKEFCKRILPDSI